MRSIHKEQPLRSAAHPSLLCCLFLVLALVVLLPQESNGFQPLSITTTTSATTKATNRQHSRLNAAIIDPAEIPAILTTAQHAVDTITSQNPMDLPIYSLSAILTSTIVPSVHAMAELHAAASTTAIPIANAASTATATIQDILPDASEAIQAQAQRAMDLGWNIMDASKFENGGAASLPGFSETKSILAPHLLPGPRDEAITMKNYPEGMFKAQLSYSTMMLRAFQKLPYIAFGYALFEFFFLRNDVDIYKEDVEDDPAGVFAETVSDVGVRFAFLFVLAVITFVIA